MARLIGAVIAIICALCTPVVAAVARPIAVATDLRGDVRLHRAGAAKAEPLTQTTFLQAGDRLRAGKDGRATLLQLHAPALAIGANQTVILRGVEPSARTEVLTPDLFVLLEKHLGAAVRSVGQKSADVSRGAHDVAVTALAPRHSLVLEEHPTFEWTPVKDATSYRITLYDAQDIIVWQTTTRQTQARYPDSRKPLAPGEYAWEVLAQAGSQKGLNTAPFTIPTRPRAAEVRSALARAARLVPDPDATNLPYLAVCLEYRLYPQAETALKRAAARSPEDRVLPALIMRLYQLTHRWDEREQARPLSIDAK